MSNTTQTVIRLSITNEVRDGLKLAKKRYPTLSDPEILKLGLAKIVTEYDDTRTASEDRVETRASSARAVGDDYLSDAEEDIYCIHWQAGVLFVSIPKLYGVYTAQFPSWMPKKQRYVQLLLLVSLAANIRYWRLFLSHQKIHLRMSTSRLVTGLMRVY